MVKRFICLILALKGLSALPNFSLAVHQTTAQDRSLGSSSFALGTQLAVGQRPPGGGRVPKTREMNGGNMRSATGPVPPKVGQVQPCFGDFPGGLLQEGERTARGDD